MIEFKHISKSYGKQRVLNDATLCISPGRIFTLLGPNGSGKTTLLKSLLGIILPSRQSEIRVDQNDIFRTHDYKRQIGYMPQSPKFPPNLKVAELLRLIAWLRQQKPVFQQQLCDELGINYYLQKSFSELSGGMVQKVNLAQAFMFDSSIFVLDEPTLGLDPNSAFFFKSLVKQRKNAGKTVLFTSHVMAEVDELADLMALLVEGKVYTVISPTELKTKMQQISLEAALHHFWRSAVSHA